MSEYIEYIFTHFNQIYKVIRNHSNNFQEYVHMGMGVDTPVLQNFGVRQGTTVLTHSHMADKHFFYGWIFESSNTIC